METNGMPQATGSSKACPICGKSAAAEFLPFCSRRCANVDLHRWLSGVYAVPVVEDEDGEKPTVPEQPK